jgi:hypothetical protein
MQSDVCWNWDKISQTHRRAGMWWRCTPGLSVLLCRPQHVCSSQQGSKEHGWGGSRAEADGGRGVRFDETRRERTGMTERLSARTGRREDDWERSSGPEGSRG